MTDNGIMNYTKPKTFELALNEAKATILKLARSMQFSSPYLDIDDLISCGMLGLFQAWNNFTTNETTKFTTYSYFRIKGSMIDEIRKNQLHKRNVMNKLKKLTVDTTNKEYEQDNKSNILYMKDYKNISTVQYELSDNCSVQAIGYLLQEEKYGKINSALNSLHPDEKNVLEYRFREDLKLKEVGKVLSLSEARIHQIQKSALSKLKNLLDEEIAC